MAVTRRRRSTRWTPAAIPIGLLLMLLGAWTFFVPLVGPYFGYGFFTNNTWTFSGIHWELMLGTGILMFVGGLLMTMPAAPLGSFGGLLTLVAGVWLLVGPSIYPLWGARVGIATPHGQTLRTLLWIGYFYGSGAIAVYLSALAHGMLSRRRIVEEQPVIEETPVERRDRIVTHV